MDQDNSVDTTVLISSSDRAREPINLTWSDLSYTVQVGKKGGCCSRGKTSKTIVRNLSGYVEHGQLLAIIGSSGAGKTTFLDILAGRDKTGHVQGSVLVNGKKQTSNFKYLAGYVTQDDVLMGTQTVAETLRFYAKLKLPKSTPRRKRETRVKEVIEELGLSKVRDTYVGSQFKRGVSGGEKKRVGVGAELITDPSILFLDEPTTGLDSYNSLAVMEVLADLAKAGRTIITTIHQPRTNIFDLFDRLLILSEGEAVYFGPAQDARAYFNALHYDIKPTANPADAILDIVVQNERDRQNENTTFEDEGTTNNSRSSYKDLAGTYKSSNVFQKVRTKVSQLNEYASGINTEREPTPNWFVKTALLIYRNFVNVARTPQTSFVQLFQTVFMALLVGTVFFKIKDNQGSIQDRVGCLFFIITNTAFSQFSALALFLEERNVFNRERASGMYGTTAYFFAKNVLDLTWVVIFPVVFAAIAYYMIGLQPSVEKFGIFLAILEMFTLVATSIFLTIGSLSPNLKSAQIITPISLVLLLLFGGFYLTNDNVPIYYRWLHVISPFRYAYEALMYNEFVGLKFAPDLDANGTIIIDNYIPTGEAQLARMGMADINIGTHLAILAGSVVVLRIFAFIGLCTLYKEKR